MAWQLTSNSICSPFSFFSSIPLNISLQNRGTTPNKQCDISDDFTKKINNHVLIKLIIVSFLICTSCKLNRDRSVIICKRNKALVYGRRNGIKNK